MRVKLSYTAEAEDILKECSYLLNNKGNELKEVIDLYSGLIADLQLEEANTRSVFEKIDALRKGLSNVDIRLMEIGQIVAGFEEYHKAQREGEVPPAQAHTPQPELAEGAPSVSVKEVEVLGD